MMKNGVAKEERWINWLDMGLLIVMVAGIVIAIERQQVAWGLIPIALTIILNQIKQGNQQRSQQQQFQNLERLIQNSQSEQESQQINLWKLQKQIEEWQDFLIDFRETHTQNNQTIQEIIAELSQFQSLGEKQTDVQNQLQKISVTQEQLITDFNQLSQSQETLSQTVEDLTQERMTQEKIDHLHDCLEQLTEFLSTLAQGQTEVSQTLKNHVSKLQDQL